MANSVEARGLADSKAPAFKRIKILLRRTEDQEPRTCEHAVYNGWTHAPHPCMQCLSVYNS